MKLLEDSTVAAVSSRALSRARAFADEFDVPRAYDSYEALIADNGVDIVYVATPHPQHVPVVRAALEAGKAVLCEKAMSASLVDTEALAELARDKYVFLLEAMWTRFTPLIIKALSLIRDGAIGDIRSLRADLGFIAPDEPSSRLWDPALGGGALLDVGIYPVAFAQMVLGAPDGVVAAGALTPQGVDADASLLLTWSGGQRALLDASFVAPLEGSASIVGTKGRIDFPPRFHHPTRIVHVDAPKRGVEERFDYEHVHEGRGYVPMLRAAADAVRDGRTECPEMPLEDSVEVMRVLQTALDQLGVRYP